MEIIATLDTGANVSILNSRMYQGSITPVTGEVKLASSDATVPRIGKTRPLNVHTPTGVIQHCFELMNMEQDTHLLLGRDLITQLGISISSNSTKARHNPRNRFHCNL